MAQKVFVTGATGFVGKHLVKALSQRGDEILCLVRATSNRKPLELPGVRFVEGDIRKAETMVEAIEEADIVFHVAAFLKAPWMEAFKTINIDGTDNVARVCAEAKNPPILVVVSTLAAAGPLDTLTPRTEEQPVAPISIYGQTKLQAEEKARSYADRVPTTIVRPPGVFGDGDPSFSKLFGLIQKGWHVVSGRKGQKMSMIHVADLADALIRAATDGERIPKEPTPEQSGQGVYYIAHDQAASFAELGQYLGKALGKKRVWIIHIPKFIFWSLAFISESMGRLRKKPAVLNLDKAKEAFGGNWICSTEKAKKQLGFKAQATLQGRLQETIQNHLQK